MLAMEVIKKTETFHSIVTEMASNGNNKRKKLSSFFLFCYNLKPSGEPKNPPKNFSDDFAVSFV
ncbi:CLUMA_CG008817, isoform A [Clunio marinus]|uniref:CLUMA_CG008817, isoform A n=1 Tax=Clunio marinus TaxID=568069 RepID=A0A1J1I6I7_9DIPT|nr:CLUMA_CG008817, isoform A [Clunio marinus]